MSAAALSETRVLVVAGDSSSVDSSEAVLEGKTDRFEVETAASPEEGLDLLTDSPPD